jgi:hypothetical protein
MNPASLTGLPGRENRARRSDFYHRYDQLLANWYLLTDRIQQEIEEVRQDLHDDLACWQPHQPEPDWNAYTDRVNVICRDGGFQPPRGSAR